MLKTGESIQLLCLFKGMEPVFQSLNGSIGRQVASLYSNLIMVSAIVIYLKTSLTVTPIAHGIF